MNSLLDTIHKKHDLCLGEYMDSNRLHSQHVRLKAFLTTHPTAQNLAALKAIESKAGFWKYIVEPTIETSESAAKASLSLRVWQNNTNQYKKTQTYLFTKEELARYDFQSDEYASPTYI